MTLMIAAVASAKKQNNFGYDYQSLGYHLDEEAIYEGVVLVADAITMTDSVAIRVDSVDRILGLPTLVEFCVSLCVRDDERDVVIGDIIERYNSKHRRLGNVRAYLYAYLEMFLSFYHFVKRALSNHSPGGIDNLSDDALRVTGESED